MRGTELRLLLVSYSVNYRCAELYESVITANHVEDQTKRMLKIKKLLHELPEHNFETFHFIAQHLNLVSSHEPTNKVREPRVVAYL